MINRQRGQAAVELMLMLFVLITFVAASFQIFLVNRTVFRSLSAVHQTVFEQAFDRNCFDARDDDGCDYSDDPPEDGYGGPSTLVVWHPDRFPEVKIPVLGLFRGGGLNDNLRLSSLEDDQVHRKDGCAGLPCKHTRLGAGTHASVFRGMRLLASVIDAGTLLQYAERAAFSRFISVIER